MMRRDSNYCNHKRRMFGNKGNHEPQRVWEPTRASRTRRLPDTDDGWNRTVKMVSTCPLLEGPKAPRCQDACMLLRVLGHVGHTSTHPPCTLHSGRLLAPGTWRAKRQMANLDARPNPLHQPDPVWEPLTYGTRCAGLSYGLVVLDLVLVRVRLTDAALLGWAVSYCKGHGWILLRGWINHQL